MSIDRRIIHVNVPAAQQILIWRKWLRQDETGLEEGGKKKKEKKATEPVCMQGSGNQLDRKLIKDLTAGMSAEGGFLLF